MNQEKIGKFIYERRKLLKLTQEELSEKLNVSNKTVSRWERGINMPDLSMLSIIASELDVSINDLLSGEIIDKKDSDNEFQKNTINLILNNNIKNKKTIYSSICLSIILIILFKIFINNITFILKYNNESIYIENNNVYGLRLVSKNNCNSNMNYIIKKIKIDNKEETLLFTNIKCSLKDEYNHIKNESLNSFKYYYFDELNNINTSYKIFYTKYSLNSINKYSKSELMKIIKSDKTKLIYESEK